MNLSFLLPRARLPVLLLACGWLLAGCSVGGRAESGAFPDAEQRRRGALKIEPVAASGPQAEFTSVTALDVDSRGRVYVGDWYRQRVTVLGPDGGVVGSFGRRGDGPGEFRAIRGVQVLRGDSVLVYDPTAARVSVYAPDATVPAYTENLRAALGGPAPFYLWRTAGGDGYLALFRPGFMFMEGRTSPARRDVLRLLTREGTPRATLAEFPSRGFLVAGTSVTPNPFGREGLVAADSRGRVLYLWNDSLAIHRFAPDGTPVDRIALPYVPGELTAGDVRRQLARWDDGTRATFARALEDSAPARWPAASALLVDDQDRIWVALAGEPDSAAEWIVLSPEGRYQASVLMPPRTTPRAVRGDRVYAERLDEDDVPAIVTYRVAGLSG